MCRLHLPGAVGIFKVFHSIAPAAKGFKYLCPGGGAAQAGGNFARQEYAGKFVQKITKRRFTPANRRVIIKPHGVWKESVPPPVLERLPSPDRKSVV